MGDIPERQLVPFYGDELAAAQSADGTVYVLFRKLCENLGLDWRGQLRRVQAHGVLSKALSTVQVQTEGGPQRVQALRLDRLTLWLATLQSNRVKEELREKLERYQEEAANVLYTHFRSRIENPTADSPAIRALQQIADMGQAIHAMALQQIELERKQQALGTRMDNAARVVKDLQQRVGLLEDLITPASLITDGQAATVSASVKALAEALTAKEGGKNQYQSIFAELYRRLGVSSYKNIRLDQYESVLTFLESWRRVAGGED